MTQASNHGKIMLVGLGPGSHDYMTGRSRAAIAEADTVIGYATYIRLIKDLLDGKEVIKKAMTEELDRAIEAYERAKQGKKVAIVSSGDAGVPFAVAALLAEFTADVRNRRAYLLGLVARLNDPLVTVNLWASWKRLVRVSTPD